MSALVTALASVGLTAEQLEQLERHWELLIKWNQRVNLTSITDPVEAAWLHYRDSLEGLRVLHEGPIVDLGSGGGFPGIPLAVARPDWQFTLLEPRQKRASFLEAATARLGLKNVRVKIGRSDEAPDQRYAAAVTRATFSDPQELRRCLAWVRPGGQLVAYRTPTPHFECDAVHSYELRGTARVLAILRA